MLYSLPPGHIFDRAFSQAPCFDAHTEGGVMKTWNWNLDSNQANPLPQAIFHLRGNCWCEAYKMSRGFPHRTTCLTHGVAVRATALADERLGRLDLAELERLRRPRYRDAVALADELRERELMMRLIDG
jgi:hypothetical protein